MAKDGVVRWRQADLIAAVIPEPVRGKPIELWWQDAARVGQMGSLAYLWTFKGSRPAVPRDLGVGLVLPRSTVRR